MFSKKQNMKSVIETFSSQDVECTYFYINLLYITVDIFSAGNSGQLSRRQLVISLLQLGNGILKSDMLGNTVYLLFFFFFLCRQYIRVLVKSTA